MKFDQFKHELNRNFIETSFFLRKNIQRKKEYFLHWGHEKMTVMFIPHNEKKIFNFQISKFTFLFFVMLFGIVIATSIFAAQKNQSLKKTEDTIFHQYETKQFQLAEIQNLSISVRKIFNQIKPEVENLYSMTTGIKNNQKIWSSSATKDTLLKDSTDKSVAIRQISEKIYELQELQKEIVSASETINTIEVFISNQNKVLNETPSYIPNSGYITSLFGWRISPFGFGRDFHSGVDIAASIGTPIKATAPGTVEIAGWGGGYGNMVRIKHKYGFETIYAHCSRLNVRAGDYVKKGQIIAFVGDTGSVTGSHCHYEMRLDGTQIDPLPYMNKHE